MVGLTYGVLALLILIVLPISISAIPKVAPWASLAPYVALAVMLLLGALLRRERRRDLHQLCVFGVLMGFLATILSFTGVVDRPWLCGPLLALSVTGWIGSIVVVIADGLARDKVPSPMLQRFPAAQVREVAGVQLALDVADATRAVAGEVELRLHLLNCWDRERTVKPSLSSRHGLLGVPGGALVDDAETTLTLAPGAFGTWVLPVTLQSARAVSIFVGLDVAGLDGRRLYRQRVQPLPARVSRTVTVLVALASLGTHWVWGGGLRVRIPAGERKSPAGPRLRRWFSLSS